MSAMAVAGLAPNSPFRVALYLRRERCTGVIVLARSSIICRSRTPGPDGTPAMVLLRETAGPVLALQAHASDGGAGRDAQDSVAVSLHVDEHLPVRGVQAHVLRPAQGAPSVRERAQRLRRHGRMRCPARHPPQGTQTQAGVRGGAHLGQDLALAHDAVADQRAGEQRRVGLVAARERVDDGDEPAARAGDHHVAGGRHVGPLVWSASVALGDEVALAIVEDQFAVLARQHNRGFAAAMHGLLQQCEVHPGGCTGAAVCKKQLRGMGALVQAIMPCSHLLGPCIRAAKGHCALLLSALLGSCIQPKGRGVAATASSDSDRMTPSTYVFAC